MKIPNIPAEYRFAHADVEYLLRRDSKELRKCAKIDAYKATMLLAGGMVECALGDFLSRRKTPALAAYASAYPTKKGKSITDWTLAEMLSVAKNLHFIEEETYKLCDLGRGYRNLIHPAVEQRGGVIPTAERALSSVKGLTACLNDLEKNAAKSLREIYVVNISGVPHRHVDSPDNLAKAIEKMAETRGHSVTKIRSIGDFEQLLLESPEDAVIFNIHGELIPTPPTYSGKPKDLFQAIGTRVKEKGWAFISLAGYPFYAYDNDVEVGEAGLNSFLSIANAYGTCMNPGTVDFTTDGTKVIKKFNLKAWPHSLNISRCARWNIVPYRSFLRKHNRHGASILKIGWGYFVQIGVIATEDLPEVAPITRAFLLGNLAFAFAASVWS
jgi:hypothetical protein